MTNKIICGDNINTLDLVDDNSIQLCYLDPPYNVLKAQNKYKDSFSSHTEWCEMMEPRLIKAYQKLLLTGVIAVSIDDTEHAYLRILMDKLFGEKNFIANLIWIKAASQQTTKTFIKKSEHIICFAKDKKMLKMNRRILEVKDDKRYKFRDEKETFWILQDGSVSFTKPETNQIEVKDNIWKDDCTANLSKGTNNGSNHNKLPIEVKNNIFADSKALTKSEVTAGRSGENNPIEVKDNQHYQDTLALSATSQSECRIIGKNDPIEVSDNAWFIQHAGQSAPSYANGDDNTAAIEVAEQMNWKIYIHEHIESGKVYIGQTNKSKLEYRTGKDGSGYKGCKKFYNAIKLYGWKAFTTSIITIVDTKEQADYAEIDWIAIAREFLGEENVYNTANGGNGGGNSGVPMAEEQKEKIRKSLVGHAVSQETRDKLSSTNKLKGILPPSRAGTIPWNKGIPMSDEQKTKISETKKKEENEYPPVGTLIFPKTAWRWCRRKIEWAQANNLVGFKKNKKGEWVAFFKQYKYLTTAKDKDGNYKMVAIVRSSPYETVLQDIPPDRVLSKLFGVKNVFHYSKPVPLMARLLEIFTNKNDNVLDVFAGSGSMNQACFEQERNCTGLQSDENGIFDDALIPRLKAMIGENNFVIVMHNTVEGEGE